jgi:hypothetical protein
LLHNGSGQVGCSEKPRSQKRDLSLRQPRSAYLCLTAWPAELFQSIKGNDGWGGAAQGFLGSVGVVLIVSDQVEEPIGRLLLAS